jgi:hypothetical protein
LKGADEGLLHRVLGALIAQEGSTMAEKLGPVAHHDRGKRRVVAVLHRRG